MGNTHIFLDNSNIFGGAQKAAQEIEKAHWLSARIYYDNLFRLMLHNKKNRRTSMLAGSVPPGNEALWDAAKAAGFDTTLLKRVKSDKGRLIEQGVDEVIHLKIANILLDEDTPGVMIIVTGDGKVTEQGCSFTQQVIRAAKLGWSVEVWSWRAQLSKKLRDVAIKFPDKVKIYKLDNWYKSLVFLEAGEYINSDGSKHSTSGRRAEPLWLTDETFQSGLEPLIAAAPP